MNNNIMPQFDKITFFNQIFWLLLLFFSFYIILLKTFLPKISSSLKARSKKLLKSNSLANDLNTEEFSVTNSSSTLFTRSASFCRANLTKGAGQSHEWLHISNKDLTASDLKNTQIAYLKNFSNISARKFVI